MDAIYAGSFDPFTNGHLHIVRQASKMFGAVDVLIATNQDKKLRYDSATMARVIREVFKQEGLENVSVWLWPNRFVADYAQLNSIEVLVRGLRNDMDFQYEETIAKVNKEINPKLDTIYLRADNEIISSSFVKMMFDAGKDISKYVPKPIEDLMKGVKDNDRH